MPRKPGGKYKGKIGRAKGEATIALELEAKRRKAYEANLARLQERRAQDMLAEQGLQSAEEEAQALKLAKIAQMFGHGKKGTLRKFWKNWKIGMIAMRREKAITERKTCWRRSCSFCDVVPATLAHMHGKFSLPHTLSCKSWWRSNLGRDQVGEELHPLAAARDRPQIVNDYRQCTCCGVDTGATGLGCRCWHQLRDVEFMNPSESAQRLKATRFEQFPTQAMMAGLASSSSAPVLHSPKSARMTLSSETNWVALRSNSPAGAAPEYDPSELFALSAEQTRMEERRAWSDDLTAMAGSPWTRKRSGEIGLPSLPPISPTVPSLTDRGVGLEEVTHWRTGQKTMLDKHMMKMYVVGVQ